MSNASEDFFAAGPRDNDPLLDDLKSMLRNHAESHSRSNQVALGPSQVGHPCARNVIQGMLALRKINPDSDPLPSYIGVASHAAMENAAHLANQDILAKIKISEGENWPSRLAEYGWPRWLPETKVDVREGLSGTCDLYDTWTDTVIDHKFPGTTAMTKYRKLIDAGQPPNPLYRIQAHLYGKGYRNAGRAVKRVAIWFIPRAGQLATSKLWIEDYSEQLVQETLSHLDDLIVLMHDLELEKHSERLAWIPINPYECQWCPWFSVRADDPNPAACSPPSMRPPVTDHIGMAPLNFFGIKENL